MLNHIICIVSCAAFAPALDSTSQVAYIDMENLNAPITEGYDQTAWDVAHTQPEYLSPTFDQLLPIIEAQAVDPVAEEPMPIIEAQAVDSIAEEPMPIIEAQAVDSIAEEPMPIIEAQAVDSIAEEPMPIIEARADEFESHQDSQENDPIVETRTLVESLAEDSTNELLRVQKTLPLSTTTTTTITTVAATVALTSSIAATSTTSEDLLLQEEAIPSRVSSSTSTRTLRGTTTLSTPIRSLFENVLEIFIDASTKVVETAIAYYNHLIAQYPTATFGAAGVIVAALGGLLMFKLAHLRMNRATLPL